MIWIDANHLRAYTVTNMEKVFKEIQRMGVYDPLLIKLDKRFSVTGLGMINCVSGLKLDNNIFNEGREIQHPNIKTYCKIKPVWCKIKHAHFVL